MKNYEVYQDILKEFDEVIAINATILISINATKQPTLKELRSNTYLDTLMTLFNRVLWELPPEKSKLCLDIWSVYYNYQTGKILSTDGQYETLKELIEEKV